MKCTDQMPRYHDIERQRGCGRRQARIVGAHFGLQFALKCGRLGAASLLALRLA